MGVPGFGLHVLRLPDCDLPGVQEPQPRGPSTDRCLQYSDHFGKHVRTTDEQYEHGHGLRGPASQPHEDIPNLAGFHGDNGNDVPGISGI